MSERGVLDNWGIPYMQRGGVTLISRRDVPELVRRIVSESHAFLGFEGFVVDEQSIYPSMDAIADWSGDDAATVEEVLAQVAETPPEVTHFEFVWK